MTKISWLLDGFGFLALLLATFVLVVSFVATNLTTIGTLFAMFFPALSVAVASLLAARVLEIIGIARVAKPGRYRPPEDPKPGDPDATDTGDTAERGEVKAA
jgi:membrane protein implicated in regulation of membrane protease activity